MGAIIEQLINGKNMWLNRMASALSGMKGRQPTNCLNGSVALPNVPHFLEKSFVENRKNGIERQQVKHFSAVACQVAATTEQPELPSIGTLNFEMRLMKRHDDAEAKEVLDFLLDQFLFDEPLCESLNIGKEEAKPYFKGLIDVCRQKPISFLVRLDGKLVGVCLNQLLRRDDSSAINLYSSHYARKFGPGVRKFCQLLHPLEAAIWDLVPDHINQLCNMVFMSVHRDFWKLKIGNEMAAACLERLRQLGTIQAAVGEVTATGTQKLARKHGFFPLVSIPYAGLKNEHGEQIIRTKDISQEMQLVCKIF